ncbi:MAG: hypothetical protein J5502_10940 [Prevotella sp.]|nr:hypothetical protein [Prevotella sp.]
MDDDKTIGIAVDGAFGLVTSTISFLSPSLGIAAVAIAPAVTEKIKDWLKRLVKEEKITSRECSRMTDGINGITETILSFKDKAARNDELLKCNDDGFCDADDVFELMINHIKQDSEKKKAYYCGNFIGSIPYATDLRYSHLMQYARTISQLSYSELCLIRIFYTSFKDRGINFSKAEQHLKKNEDIGASELLADILHMRNLGLLHNVVPHNLGDNVGTVMISFSGKRLYKLMRLNLLDDDDVNNSMRILLKII